MLREGFLKRKRKIALPAGGKRTGCFAASLRQPDGMAVGTVYILSQLLCNVHSVDNYRCRVNESLTIQQCTLPQSRFADEKDLKNTRYPPLPFRINLRLL